jgi:nucleoside 2-deoxyribosyltransferase
MLNCLICWTPNVSLREISGIAVYSCPRCGNWGLARLTADITNSLQNKLGDWDAKSVHLRSRLSHMIRRQQRPDMGYVQMPIAGDFETWHLEEALPAPSEQLDLLIVAVGDYQPSAAESTKMSADALSAEIGAMITRQSPNAGLGWLLDQPNTKSLVERHGDAGNAILLRLTMEGWLRHGTLKRARIESRRVLMAMQFNDPELDQVVEKSFRPAVKCTGFELRLLTDKQPAGLIDDQLRVALRTSRFVIADLTHSNNGAYWEAGFAEGLGRPVIYTCREKEWRERKTHFDTNHLVTVVWSIEKLDHATEQLVARIRATLPEEATMTDI